MTNKVASSFLKLTPKERIFVESRLSGMSQVASAAAAGYGDPTSACTKVERQPNVQAALLAAMEHTAEEVGFSRKEAHEMLMGAYMGAATAAEQIQAVKEMINLHGLAVPKKIEVDHKVTGRVSLERMETAQLVKLAGMESLVLEGEFEELEPRARIEYKS